MDKINRDSYIDRLEEAFFRIEKGRIYRTVIGDVERLLIEKALEHSYGNQITAARVLGINRNTLRAKIRKLHIDVVRFRR